MGMRDLWRHELERCGVYLGRMRWAVEDHLFWVSKPCSERGLRVCRTSDTLGHDLIHRFLGVGTIPHLLLKRLSNQAYDVWQFVQG